MQRLLLRANFAQLPTLHIFRKKTGVVLQTVCVCTQIEAILISEALFFDKNLPTESRGSLLPMEGKKDPLLKVVTTELAVVTAVTSKRRLARFWAFSAALDIGSFSAR